MKPILFEGSETSFLSNGLGRIDAISCVVTEERNGQYELEMEVSIDDEHFDDIREGRILYVRHDETQDKQPFDIYYISRPLNGRVTVFAHHISYRTAKITVMPFEASSIGLTLTAIENHVVGTSNPFTLWTNKIVNGNFSINMPKTLRSLLAGEGGSLLDVYGTGEYEWDKFNIKLHMHRGIDSGVVLRYGKDITDLKKTTDMSNVWTGVVPYYNGDPSADDGIIVTLTEKVLMASNASSYDYEMIVPLDLSSYFDGPPTEAQLRTVAQQYLASNTPTIPATIDVSFINLAALEEYQNVAALQRLKLCDTVTVKYDKLGVSNTAKIIKTEYDVLTERYISMTLGEVSTNLDTALMGGIKGELNEAKRAISTIRSTLETRIQQTIDEQTELITGGSGGHVVLKRDANGKPTEILIMDTDSQSTAAQVLRINVNGIGFSSHGISGPYASAWTLDGRFNANFISAGTLNAGLIKVGALTDTQGKNYWNLETGEFRLAANTTIGNSDSAVSLIDTIDEKSAIFYGIYRVGTYTGYTPPSAGDTMLANGDMRYDGTDTYICTDYRYGTWTLFTDAKTGDYFVDKNTGSTYRWDGAAWSKVTDYKSAISTYDTALNQQAVFDKLTNNGQTQGIYLNNGNLYINASYINSGSLSANRINGGVLTLGGSNNVDGKIEIKSASGTIIGKWDNAGIDILSGTINIGNGIFRVDLNGDMSASNASINGTFFAGDYGDGYIELNSNGMIVGGANNHEYGSIDMQGVTYDEDLYYNRYGIQMAADVLRISTNKIAVSNSSVVSAHATYGFTGTIDNCDHVEIRDNGNGTISWSYTNSRLKFINGIFVGYD